MRTIDDYKNTLQIEIDHYFEELLMGTWKNRDEEKEKEYQNIYDTVSEIISSTQ